MAAHQQLDVRAARLPHLRSTGERNGFTVLTEAEFYDFHLTTPDLSVMLIKVGAAGRKGVAVLGWGKGQDPAQDCLSGIC